MYIGIGYDVHRLKKGRPLILGGVRIQHARGLAGHSDADVLIHALMDALLGAAGLADIGHRFPNSDPRYRDISSLTLLDDVTSGLKKNGFAVNNVDMTLIAEEPVIAPYIPRMKENISRILKLPSLRVGIKATTNEGIGGIGRREGIAALSVASLRTTARRKSR